MANYRAKGNLGWSTKGKDGKSKPGRPPGTDRKMRSLRASDLEWKLILGFACIIKETANRNEIEKKLDLFLKNVLTQI